MKKNLVLFALAAFIAIVIPSVYADAEFSFKFGTLGSGSDELDNPTDVVVNVNGGDIYVVDNNNERISVFDDDGNPEFVYGSFCNTAQIQNCNADADGADEDGDGQFNDPISIAIDALGRFFVVDTDNERVQVFDDDGEFQFKFGSSDSGDDDYLGSANGVVIQDSSRDIFVSDTENDSISVFNSLGNFLFDFNFFNGNDDFRNPNGMVIDNSDNILFVVDSGNDRIVMFEIVDGTTCPSGTVKSVDGICYLKEFGSSGDDAGEFDNPYDLAFDSSNNLLYVADSENNRIQIFEIVDGTTCPSNTEEIIDGVCFVEEFGSLGTTDGKFDTPKGIAFDSSNNLLYVADSNNNRIQAFELNSEPTVQTPVKPANPDASPISPTSILLTWDEPEQAESIPKITGYKIEYKTGSDDYITITPNTDSTVTSFIHQGLSESETYSYRIYSINSAGISGASSVATTKPEHTTTPVALTATAISPSQIKLSWIAPSQTFGQTISGYDIKREVVPGVYDVVGNTNAQTLTYVVSNLATDKTYTYAVTAKIGFGETEESNTASATPRTDSEDTSETPITSTAVDMSVSSPPIKLVASAKTSTSINLTWSAPVDDGNSPITGYKIEAKKDNDSFSTVIDDTKNTSKTYLHSGLVKDAKYTYRVSAINMVGTSEPSNESSAVAKITGLEIAPIGKLTINEGQLLSFAVKLTDNTIKDPVFSLKNAPSGAKIISNTGMFTWTPSISDGGKTYNFVVEVRKNELFDSQTIVVTVNDSTKESEPTETPVNTESEELGIAPFVDESKDPQSYVDRYNNEPSYKKWFDENYPEYSSIYEAVGISKPPQIPADFVDEAKDPYYYVARYNIDSDYKKWFDENYPEYSSIKQAVDYDDSKPSQKEYGFCGSGTKLIDGVCTVIKVEKSTSWWNFWN
ncbi:fibronectin type III domain-containing protein [Candidatus Nitrosopumilus koreensis AR1]|uniref:Fibronectin type III domain-containing protein n=1 Tax=Candidatus Nitrosopumilus koreensis AR1 TaxID=1229908 RepID=K0B4V4_9ARCH|nr:MULTISPECIES: fibronectin type III domain-containing protein [Nitrosopumilus]AFS81213.1 fibronectin type III domain-containing protein [Candidatus Nitrosopumilus koreensis AR1]